MKTLGMRVHLTEFRHEPLKKGKVILAMNCQLCHSRCSAGEFAQISENVFGHRRHLKKRKK